VGKLSWGFINQALALMSYSDELAAGESRPFIFYWFMMISSVYIWLSTNVLIYWDRLLMYGFYGIYSFIRRLFFQYPDRFFSDNCFGWWTFRIWMPKNVPRQYKDICWNSHNMQSTNNHEILKSSHGHFQEWLNYLHREIDICPNQHSATHTVNLRIHILLVHVIMDIANGRYIYSSSFTNLNKTWWIS